MARFMIFDTQAINTSTNAKGEYSSRQSQWGTPGVGPTGANLSPITPWADYHALYADPLLVPSAIANASAGFGHSFPVRLSTVEGVVEEIAYEFVLDGEGAALDIAINWYQEFYNDAASPYQIPYGRKPPLKQNTPWAREQIESIANTGLITHDNIVRSVTMNVTESGTVTNSGNQGDSRYFPMKAYGLWVRLRIFTLTNLSLPAGYNIDATLYPAAYRLRVFAIVGGHEQVPAMDATAKLDLLWDDVCVMGPLVWDPAAAMAGTASGTYTGTWPT
jgi:hypothetical protein